jgi:hypothetical protein
MGFTHSQPGALPESGLDVSLIEANLRLSAEQRALRHQAALDVVIALEFEGSKARGRPEATARAPVRR